MPTATPIAEPVKKTATANFVVLSRSNCGVWGGESLQWTTNPLRGITYEEANAKRARHALSLKSESTDVEVVTKEEAMTILGQLRGPVGTSHLVAASKVAHAALYPAAKPARSTLRPRASSGFDIDAILEEDDSELLAARAKRKAAAQEVKEAQQLLADAVAKLEEAQRHYENCMGHVQPGREEQAPEEKRGYTKRGALKGAVRQVLSESSHLSMEAIIEKVMGKIDLKADNPEGSIKQCIYGMTSSDEVSKNDHGAYALTAFGRERMKEAATSK